MPRSIVLFAACSTLLPACGGGGREGADASAGFDLAVRPDPGDAAVPVQDAAPCSAEPLLAAGAPSCLADSWCWSLPRPQGNSLRAIAGSSARDLWAGGELGTVLHFDGAAWRTVAAPPVSVESVAAAGGAAWVVGWDLLAQWDGTGFVAQKSPVAPQRYVSAWASGPKDAWALPDDPTGTIVHFDGAAWRSAGPGYGTEVHGSGPRDVWFASDTGLLHYDGKTLAPAGPPGFRAVHVHAVAAGDVWASGYEWGNDAGVGDVVLYHLSGGSWSRVTGWRDVGARSFDVPSITGGAEDDVWLWSARAVRRWDGAGWRSLPASEVLADANRAVWSSGAKEAWAVGDHGRLVRFDGAAWSCGRPSPVPRALWGSSASDVWAVSRLPGIAGRYWDGPLLHWDGAAWHEVDVPGGQQARALWGSAANDVWAAGSLGTLLHYDGVSWTHVVTGPDLDASAGGLFSIASLWGSGKADVWAVGSDIRHFDGARWSVARGLPANEQLLGVWGSASSDVWAVGYAEVNGVPGEPRAYHFDGRSWSAANVPGCRWLNAIWGSSAADVWIGCGLNDNPNRLIHFDGKSWQARPVPGDPWQIQSIHGLGPSDVWIAGWRNAAEGVLFHYDGKSVSLSSTGMGPLDAVWAAAPGQLFAAGYSGMLRRTR